MSVLPNFPCLQCQLRSCHITTLSDLVFTHLFRESIYLADKYITDPLLFSPQDYTLMNEMDWQMYCTLSKLQKRFYEKHPNKLNVKIDCVETVDDIFPLLKHKLQHIVNHTIQFGEFSVLRHEFTLAGILPLPYQCIVLECLIVAGKFTAQYMNTFTNDLNEIFVPATNTLNNFFEEVNIVSWVKHIALEMHPFGTYP